MVKVSKKFVDLNPNFENHPITGDVLLLKNEDAVKHAIKNIVLTARGEKVFRPLFGTSATTKLFELFDPTIADEITVSIEDAIRQYDPRVKVDRVEYIDDIDNNALEITLYYEIVGLPLDEQSLNLILERV